jgi:uncharacterized protein YfaS (alpha-2-macroglobulin family)
MSGQFPDAMKTLPFLALVYAASMPGLWAAPRLFVSTPKLAPESRIELILDQAAVSDETVGKPDTTKWLKVDPPLPGKIEWKAPNVASFLPDQAPLMGITYKFSIPEGRKHLDGSPVPGGEIAAVESLPFQMEGAVVLNRHGGEYSPRNAQWLITWNDEVDPEMSVPFIWFENRRGGRVPVRTEVATVGEARAVGLDLESWGQRFDRAQPKPPVVERAERPAEEAFPHGLIVAPATPLPIGEDWKLMIGAGLRNKARTAKIDVASSRWVGTIAPFTVTGIHARTVANSPRQIVVGFNMHLPKDISEEDLKKAIRVSPVPDDYRVVVNQSQVILQGDFRDDTWSVRVDGGIMSFDGRTLFEAVSKDVVFKRLEPSLGLPSDEQAQLAAGTRTYRLETVNLKKVKVRARQLSGAELVRAFQGYRHYSGNGPDDETIKPVSLIPFELIPGTTAFEREFDLPGGMDMSAEVLLKWDELLPNAPKHATLFIEATGTLTDGLQHEAGRPSAQAIVQLTDIGLAWKLTQDEALLYAFSCTTGEALPGVKVEVFGEDAKSLSQVTSDANGLATVPRKSEARHLRATLGEDSYITAFDSSLPTVSLWRFPVRYSYEAPAQERRRVMMFTDRSLYRPGETMRLKGIVRTQRGNVIAAAGAGKPHLVITDPTQKELLDQEITLSANGSFDLTYQVPDQQVGYYTAQLVYKEELAEAEALNDEDESKYRRISEASFGFIFRVEEFRRNAFEVEQNIAEPAAAAEDLKVELVARYYQGQAVASGHVEHYSRVGEVNIYPENYRDYLFGNHRVEDWRYWYRYFNYRYETDVDEGRSTAENGEAILDAEGKATFSVALPQGEIPITREVTVRTEVRDANNQTLTATSSATIHPSSVYVGVSRKDRLVRVGDRVPLQVVAITPEGNPCEMDVAVEATLTREINEQSKTRNDAGAVVIRNDAREEVLSSGTFSIPAGASGNDGATYELVAAAPGRHFLTLKGKDGNGRPFQTTTTYWVYGSNEYPWAYEEGMKIKLVAEKKSYRPGDVARVLVLSPIDGTALVTVERESVLRSYLVEMKASDPVIEIPLHEEDAPNAFVSVLVIKGSQDSARTFKEPQLRLGYCELTVENVSDRLTVNVAASNSADALSVPTSGGVIQVASYRPADEVVLSGTVTLADGSPAAGAEVTLYAEDEGTLAVMGYENPDPMGFFYDPRNLDVMSGTSLDHFIAEDPESQQFFNKGFFVGGGGEEGADLSSLRRKNFDPCATWAPKLIADAQGKFSHSFKVPDTLTRYRVLAVATQSASRFGSTRTDIVVNKPLMLEPKAPRFANQGDLVTPQVLVQNASGHRGTWNVIFNPHAATGSSVCRALGDVMQTVTIENNGSAVVEFPISIEMTGEAILEFRAEPVALDGQTLTPVIARKLSDAVETRFPVAYPMPLLRQTKMVRLDEPGAEHNLREHLDANLLAGEGELTMEFSRSILLEAGPSIDFLLNYPHGCVEQTTSSLMPWLAVEPLRPTVPRLEKYSEEDVSKAIQAGANRLLSMQLPTGGFAYWPGSRERVDWASSYAGLGLILAKEAGAKVPDEAIELLGNDLISSLRGIADIRSASEMEVATRSLWILAIAGRPQEAYHNVLREKLENVPPRARRFLALAIAQTGGVNAKAEAAAILTNTKPFKLKDDGWMPWNPDAALDVLAWSSINPDSDETTRSLERLFRDRNPYGEWRTTWMNGWSLMALANYAKTESSSARHTLVNLNTDAGEDAIELGADSPVATRVFSTSGLQRVAVKSDSTAFVRLRLAAKPKIAPQQPVALNGLEITRFYERLKSDGTSEPLDRPAAGDLIRVSLRVTLPKDDSRYLVVDDPLPSIFETVNSDFASQAAANGGRTSEDDWNVSHSELRSDRAVFYFDHIWRRGTYTVTYLARCTVPGEVTAPAAKVESMYDPEKFALSASQFFRTR